MSFILLTALLLATQPEAAAQLPDAVPVPHPAPLCAPVSLGTTPSGAELRMAMTQHSSFYGPQLVLELHSAAVPKPIFLIRIGALRFGDGRSIARLVEGTELSKGWEEFDVGRSAMEAVSHANRIDLVDTEGTRLSFVPDQAAHNRFRACVEALPVGSNEIPAINRSGASRYAQLAPNRVVSHGRLPRMDYPAAALREERSGLTMTEVEIQPDGSPHGCIIVSSSGSPDLDLASCRGVMRANFRAATDAVGEPIVAKVRVPVRWAIAD